MSEFKKVNACAKRPIDIWTNYLYYTISVRIVYLIRNVRAITPNGVTLFSLLLGLIGCYFYAKGTTGDVTTGLVFVQVSYVFDCADGQLARYRQQYSPIGGWLDQVADRVKEFAIYFSLAYGFTKFHPGNTRVWMWMSVALFALFLLEYYGQIKMKPLANKDKSAGVQDADDATVCEEADSFSRLQRLRGFVPFRGFIIGEQYFAMLIFIAFHAICAFFVFVSVLGLLMCIYRPVIQFIKLHREAA